MSGAETVRIRQIVVIGDSEADEAALDFTQNLGAALAQNGYAVITGGRGGIMEAANKGAAAAGGLSIGILPGELIEEANSFCQIVIPTSLGHARNNLTALAADAIVAIGGGAGTLSEMCFAWIHNKPIFVFRQFGGWSEKLGGATLDRRRDDTIELCEDINELLIKLRGLFKN